MKREKDERVSKELKRKIFERDNYTCKYCGQKFDVGDLEIDHIKFCDIDFDFDEEEGEEYEIWTCDKGNDTDSEEECADYKEYIARKPKETSSECDWCKYLGECDNTIECTTKHDYRRHYVKGRGFCRKDSEVRCV